MTREELEYELDDLHRDRKEVSDAVNRLLSVCDDVLGAICDLDGCAELHRRLVSAFDAMEVLL